MVIFVGADGPVRIWDLATRRPDRNSFIGRVGAERYLGERRPAVYRRQLREWANL
jgi:hypothetical protein